MQLRQRQQGECPLIGGSARVDKLEGSAEVLVGGFVLARGGMELAKQAVGADQGERLARVGRVRQGLLGPPVGLLRVSRRSLVPCPERLSLREAQHSP